MRQWLRSHLTFANVCSLAALFVALGGTTYAATGGNFILGQSNSAGNTTSLSAPIAGKKALQVTNTSTGAGATALGLNVASGHAPFTVNSGTKVANLNSDKLDGKDSSGFVLKAPEPWHEVGPGSMGGQDVCADPSNTAVFCNLDFVRSWVNYGEPFATAGFYKDQLGIVHLKGLVSTVDVHFTATSPLVKPIFRLPPAYAPAHRRVFPSVGRNFFGQEISQGRVDVQPDGLVLFLQDCNADRTDCSAEGTYVTLDAISFRRDG